MSPALLQSAVALAGRLAELGETRITIQHPGHHARRLTARSADLPSVLVSAMTTGDATLTAETLNIQIALTPTGPRPADARAAHVLDLPK